MKYLSLFTGIGGFELGIQQAYENYFREFFQKQTSQAIPHYSTDDQGRPTRATCIGYSEIDPYAIKIYQSHFPEHKNYGDITKIKTEELPDFDMLCGGFPCQSFSIAGKRRGFEDTRGTLFYEVARILKDKKPRLCILENVKGLLSHGDGRTFATIIATLDELGYDVQWQVLNSKYFGVPQNRERVYIVGHLRGTPRPEVFPIIGQTKTATPDVFVDESQWRREGKLREYEGVSPTLNTCGGGGHLPLILQKARGYNKGGLHEISPTVSANSFQHNNHVEQDYKIRRLTPTECERLQGFPDNWTDCVSDARRYRTLGNAVTTNVVKEVVSKILI